MSPEEAVEEARRIGLEGLCFTEHDVPWEQEEFRRFAQMYPDLLLVTAREVQLDMGHVTVFGLGGDLSHIRHTEELRRAADAAGACLVAAHPFRFAFDGSNAHVGHLLDSPASRLKPAQELLRHPLFQMVDAIEVANGGNSERENALAWEMAQLLKKPMVGSSDAHTVANLGKCVTVFPEKVASPQALLAALRAGRFWPAEGLRTGKLRQYRGAGQG